MIVSRFIHNFAQRFSFTSGRVQRFSYNMQSGTVFCTEYLFRTIESYT